MRYLHREQRRDLILAAAMQLALDEGLSAMTARRVAQVAAVSTGQVHHHFQSIADLRAEVFLQLMQQLVEIESNIQTDNYFDRLILELGAADIAQSNAYIGLWNEAEVLMQQDPILKIAYKQNMLQWHAAVVKVIEGGIQAKEFVLRPERNLAEVAWRLIAFVCGLEGMYQLALFSLNVDDFKQHTALMIKAELKLNAIDQ
ncbi:TetR family transcriptional regulator [Acinetobacter calcoaceticus]|uniref:TetR family transcriptional regulator n=1 Tax=Acinetobacter calcoaceticus TaxID=471 RepID=A0A4V2R160_ACICA|nr:TetR family transcriptional regulator [Acinetobacter calcoaceticus]